MPALSIALADTILRRYPDPDDIPYRRWCYVQGYVLIGMEKLWRRHQNGGTGDRRYLDYLLRFASGHVTPAGEIPAFKGDSMDDMMAGTVIVAAYEHTGEPRYRRAAERIRAAFADYPRNSDGAFWHGRRLPHEFWIDGVFMGGMFLARYGATFGDDDALREAARQIVLLARQCRKGDSGLFLHAYDEARRAPWADPLTGLSPEVWSEGLGWYALILVETLEALPPPSIWRPWIPSPRVPISSRWSWLTTCARGEVIVAQCPKEPLCALWGGLLSNAAVGHRGAGVVTDGGARDYAEIMALRFPVFCRGLSPYDSMGRMEATARDAPITCGGVAVSPGDLIFADVDGVVVAPRLVAHEAIALAWEKVQGENRVREELRAGAGVVATFEKHPIL